MKNLSSFIIPINLIIGSFLIGSFYFNNLEDTMMSVINNFFLGLLFFAWISSLYVQDKS